MTYQQLKMYTNKKVSQMCNCEIAMEYITNQHFHSTEIELTDHVNMITQPNTIQFNLILLFLFN